MVFYLSISAIFQPTQATLRSVENLAYAGIRGLQLVTGARSALDVLAGREDLSASARSYFRRMSQRMTQLGNSLAEQERINIDLSNVSGPTNYGASVPVDVFENVDYCEKSQFIAENLTDYEVIFNLARFYLKNRLSGYLLNLRPHNGGGSTSAQVLKNCGNNSCGPVFCCADSDRKFPTDGMGSTAKGIKKAKVSDRWRVDVLIIESRELENILPRDIIEPVALANGFAIDDVSELLDLPSQYYSYCCLKNGYDLCAMMTAAAKKKRKDIIDILSSLRARKVTVVTCCGTCPAQGRCFKSAGLGVNFLQNVGLFLSNGSFSTDISIWVDDLTKLVKKVISFGIVMEPQRV